MYQFRNTNQRFPNTQRIQQTYGLFLFPSILTAFKFEQLLKEVIILWHLDYLWEL